MEKKINELYSDYRKGELSRREFLKKLTAIAGSTAAASMLLPILEENEKSAPDMQNTDPDLVAEFIKYPGATGDMRAYLARPKKGNKFPAVIVIHENRGLVPHIQDVTRRMAKEGFLSLAPDALSPVGGTPDDVSNVGELFKKLDSEETTKNFVAAVKYLKTHPNSNGKVGCTGFCWGGAMTNQVAVNAPDLNAAVPYYGRQPSAEDVAKIKAPVMAHYAENDQGINAGIAAFEEALKKNNIEYQIFTYPGTGHAFNNDTNPSRYNEEAAKLAWQRTVGFFKAKLK
ncbi:MAG TPA: dienelactone hydrolase family protein [Bacteroidales bacterium]|jgi:carboxymethylenebutenolidase|nr:twin-arginine translocation signal domain-containing protein [Bacteroidales bacterium]OQB61755.1 MAG: Carboxymethylenebutenolidase [Bacteroidetes bacterium ADurb.Bin145]NMD04044.1 twin-arginine translocation signal domain-containing protein [Bacteroidales bacterium]HOU01806.1 dienelactone hydrolase family protein [Bacteroidales bacterium]HQG63202.1 dienelactone hydrolase family protein [Bacteroidales bacterium]